MLISIEILALNTQVEAVTMSDQWLSSRLSDARKNSPQWVALFEAIEEWTAEGLLPEIAKLKDAKKTFSEDRQSLNLTIEDMGDFFDYEDLTDASRAKQNHIDILWRRHELHNKRLTVAFESYVNRVMKLHGMSINWEPLYYRSDEDYATANFYPKIGSLEEHAQLPTQRGSIFTDISYLSPQSSGWIVDKLNLALSRARQILPEHIVAESAIIKREVKTRNVHFAATLGAPIMACYGTNKGDVNTGHVIGPSVRQSFAGTTTNLSNATYGNNKGDINIGGVNVEGNSLDSLRATISQAHIAHASGKTER